MRVVEKRQLLSAEEIDRTLQRLAHEIVEKSGGTKDVALIGVRRRGVPLAQRLAKNINAFHKVEIPVGTLDITLYRDDLSTVAAHPVVQSTEIPFVVDNQDLVLVDDVLYTGRTALRDERPLRFGPSKTRAHVRADRSRPSRAAHRSHVYRPQNHHRRHRDRRSPPAGN